MPPRQEVPAGPNTKPTLWCAIFHVERKHVTHNYHLLQKIVNRWAMMSVTSITMNR